MVLRCTTRRFCWANDVDILAAKLKKIGEDNLSSTGNGTKERDVPSEIEFLECQKNGSRKKIYSGFYMVEKTQCHSLSLSLDCLSTTQNVHFQKWPIDWVLEKRHRTDIWISWQIGFSTLGMLKGCCLLVIFIAGLRLRIRLDIFLLDRKTSEKNH
jgi:hypothetical protein